MISSKSVTIVIMIIISLVCFMAAKKNRSHKAPPVRGAQPIVELLQEYIAINTAQPNPDYQSAIAFLKRLATQDGLSTQEIVLSSGRSVLVITLPGTDSSLTALALNHHMDVVAAHCAEWKYPPFQGCTEEGVLYGRGTQDMKGVGMCHYQALREIKQSGIALKRTVYMIAVPDEEIGGFTGAHLFVQTEAFKKLQIGYVLDEGLPSSNPAMLYIKTTERKPLQVRFTIAGKSAHGSQLNCDNVLHAMIDFLSKLTNFQREQQQKAQSIDCGLLLSINITSCHAGELPSPTNKAAGINIVPSCATATADIRIPAAMSQMQAKELLATFMAQYPQLSYEILAQVDDYDTPDVTKTTFYACIEKSIRKVGLQSKVLHFQATSDLRHYLPFIAAGCGITPFTTTDNLHGIDECVPLNNLIIGTQVIKEIILAFCG